METIGSDGDNSLLAKQHLYNGFGNGFARAFELAVTPAIFGFLGHLLDVALGTSPVFLIVFALFCVIGMAVRMYYGYVAAMQAQEADKPWTRKAAAGGPAGGASS